MQVRLLPVVESAITPGRKLAMKPRPAYLPRRAMETISKEQTEETRFQLSKDVGVGEVKVENQKKVLATFFQRGKMAETGEKSCSASISGRRWPNLVVGAWM